MTTVVKNANSYNVNVTLTWMKLNSLSFHAIRHLITVFNTNMKQNSLRSRPLTWLYYKTLKKRDLLVIYSTFRVYVSYFISFQKSISQYNPSWALISQYFTFTLKNHGFPLTNLWKYSFQFTLVEYLVSKF